MIKLISIDLFETLVDPSGDRPLVWQYFLGDSAPLEEAEKAWQYAERLVYDRLERINRQMAFEPMATIFQVCLEKSFDELTVSGSPETAVHQILDYHALSPWFPESRQFLDDIKTQYLVCLSSDTDNAMIGPAVRDYPFDAQFTSEQLECYKGDAENRFFKAVLSHFQLTPSAVLHVGDSPGEILAARRMGIKTCWVNRNGGTWQADFSPDHEVATLDQISSILS